MRDAKEKGAPVKHIAKFGLRFLGRLARTNISLIAAGVAFYAMLAVFPGLSALIAIWSAFADPAVIGSYLAVADDFIPPEAFAILTEQILLLLQGPRTTIGWGTVLSVAVALFSARAGVGAGPAPQRGPPAAAARRGRVDHPPADGAAVRGSKEPPHGGW